MHYRRDFSEYRHVYQHNIPTVFSFLDQEWRKNAVCAQVGYEAFDREDTYSVPLSIIKNICNQCPVKDACLQDAMDNHDDYYTIRGGLTPGARRKLRYELANKKKEEEET